MNNCSKQSYATPVCKCIKINQIRPILATSTEGISSDTYKEYDNDIFE